MRPSRRPVSSRKWAGSMSRSARSKGKAKSPKPRYEPLWPNLYILVRCHMSDTAHYRFQSDQAKRLARQVTDAAVRAKLLEMAEEYGRYADLIEARASDRVPEALAG